MFGNNFIGKINSSNSDCTVFALLTIKATECDYTKDFNFPQMSVCLKIFIRFRKAHCIKKLKKLTSASKLTAMR